MSQSMTGVLFDHDVAGVALAKQETEKLHAGADSPLRLMCIHAHPDDESSKGAATMAKYRAQGVEVLVVTCTGGERGSVLNPQMDRPEVLQRMTEIRREEMAAARSILDVEQAWLGFVDSGLPEGDPLPPLPEDCFALQPVEVTAAPLVKLMREFRPHVVTTYDENGGYPHPDHIMTHTVSVAAFEASGDPERYAEFGEAWQPIKLYYNIGFSRARMERIDELMIAKGLESPFADWLAKPVDPDRDGSKRITTQVDAAEYFGVRDDALRAHATQVDPDGRWFHIPMDVQVQGWPTEDFQLAAGVGEFPTPEDDLFAGLRPGS